MANQFEEAEPSKYYPEIPLGDELDRQREELAERVAVPLAIDRNKFLSMLPTAFPNRPQVYNDLALTIPVISVNVTPFGVNWSQLIEATLYNGLNLNNPESTLEFHYKSLRESLTDFKVWEDPRRGVQPFPEVPHAVWIQDGSRYISRKPNDVRNELQEFERAGDHLKGISITLLRPDMVQNMWWDLVGSKLELKSYNYLPYVRWYVAKPWFGYRWDGYTIPDHRALVCGKDFTAA